MDDNAPSDEENKESPKSPILGGKKLKLNDGSSQESLNEKASEHKEVKDENVDSGVTADKSESTSSEDRGGAANPEPTNEVVNAAPSSSSNVRALLNLRRPRRLRMYRKRKTPGRDSDDNSSRDSDDTSQDESSDHLFFTGFLSDTVSSHNSSNANSTSNNSSTNSDSNNDDSDNSLNLDLDMEEDSDSDSFMVNLNNRRSNNANERESTPPVLHKTRPKHNYSILREVINREMGLTFPRGKALKEDVIFEQKFYGSLHAIYRMAKFDSLLKHKGCVNSINFHPEGHLLASGSDDTNVIVWDWARNIPLQTIKTGHKCNVFQSKFLYLNSQTQLNIVTCARDGQVRLIQCPASGAGGASRRKLMSHARAAHKVHVSAHEPHVVVSAGEDGLVMRADVREDHGSRLFQVRDGVTIPLYSVAGHPMNPRHLLVAGRDRYLRVYDVRKPVKPLNLYTAFDKPTKLAHRSMHLTCAVYNHDGSEILGSYNDEDIYLFDTKLDVYDKDNTDLEKDIQTYRHKYSGHKNRATFKGVAFFGPKSEYIVSGSDCSHIFIWEKESESIVQWMEGDNNGVVNCIESHPRFPVIASSGLDKDVKIWMPRRHSDPDFQGLEKVILSNRVSCSTPMFTDFLPTIYSAWRNTLSDPNASANSNIDFDGNACTTF